MENTIQKQESRKLVNYWPVVVITSILATLSSILFLIL
jgi:hypothetical protein